MNVTNKEFIEEIQKFKHENKIKIKNIFEPSRQQEALRYKFLQNKIILEWITRTFEYYKEKKLNDYEKKIYQYMLYIPQLYAEKTYCHNQGGAGSVLKFIDLNKMNNNVSNTIIVDMGKITINAYNEEKILKSYQYLMDKLLNEQSFVEQIVVDSKIPRKIIKHPLENLQYSFVWKEIEKEIRNNIKTIEQFKFKADLDLDNELIHKFINNWNMLVNNVKMNIPNKSQTNSRFHLTFILLKHKDKNFFHCVPSLFVLDQSKKVIFGLILNSNLHSSLSEYYMEVTKNIIKNYYKQFFLIDVIYLNLQRDPKDQDCVIYSYNIIKMLAQQLNENKEFANWLFESALKINADPNNQMIHNDLSRKLHHFIFSNLPEYFEKKIFQHKNQISFFRKNRQEIWEYHEKQIWEISNQGIKSYVKNLHEVYNKPLMITQ